MKLLLDASEMLAESETPTPEIETNPDHELLIITAVCSTLISVTGLIMAAMLCSWCFGRKKYDSDEEESLNEYKPVAYNGEDSSSMRDSSIAGITPNQSPSHNGSAQCNSSSTQHLTSVGNKKSSKLFRFDRHHGDKHKIVTEHVQPPTNTNQVAHMVTEETVAFTQQKRRPSKELETKAKLQPSQRYQSIPIEMTIIEPQSVKIQDDCLKNNRRKASVTTIQSSSDKASSVTVNEGKKKNGKSVIKEEVPCTSSQTSQTKDAQKNSQQEAENNTKSNTKRSHLWRRLKMKLPLIVALRQPRAQTTAPPKRRASMFASREEFLRHISANDNLQERKSSPNKNGSAKKKIFRSLSLGSEQTVKVEPPDSPTQASNVQHLIAMFKEKIQETDKPTRQLRRESKFKVRQMKRKLTEQEKIKQYSNSPFYNSSSQSSKEETPPKPSQNVDPDKTDPSTEQEKAIQRVISGLRRCSRSMTEDEKQKAYVHLIRRRREVEQMRKQYMQRTGSSVEVDEYACDPPIPADVAL